MARGLYVTIKRLSSFNLNVVKAARPHQNGFRIDGVDFVNRGGVAIISKAGIAIAKVNSAPKIKTFGQLCCRVISQGASSVLVNIYHSGLEQLTSEFFKVFRSYLEFLSTFSLPVTITGDINIRFDRIDSDTAKFTSLLESLSISQFVTEPSHQLGGLLDVVITGPDNTH